MQSITSERPSTLQATISSVFEPESRTGSLLITYQHAVIKEAIHYLIKHEHPNMEITFAEHASDFLIKLSSFPFDLVVLDIDSDESWYTPAIVNSIKLGHTGLKIIVFSALDERIYASKYVAAGADVYLSKTVSSDTLLEVISSLMDVRGDTDDLLKAKRKNTKIKMDRGLVNPFEKLSARETQIAGLLIKGTSLVAISKMMDLNETTISTYKQRIFKKTQVYSLPDLINLYSKFH